MHIGSRPGFCAMKNSSAASQDGGDGARWRRGHPILLKQNEVLGGGQCSVLYFFSAKQKPRTKSLTSPVRGSFFDSWFNFCPSLL